jgi:cAMP-dependent protein kinase regulator
MTLESMDIEPKRKRYIIDNLNPVLEEAVGALIAAEPADPAEFLITQFGSKLGSSYNGASSYSDETPEVVKNKELYAKLEKLKDDVRKAVVVNVQLEKSSGADAAAEKEEEEEEDDVDDDIPEPPPVTRTGNRTSVSAEAYGDWNKQKTNFEPPVYEKTTEQADRIRGMLTKSFIFETIDDKNLEILVKAMHKVELKDGEKIITEGENGDYLFVVDEGKLDCHKDKSTDVLKTCSSGDIFGELALLYNAPRAASVTAKAACLLWKLDRETFGHITSAASEKYRKTMKEFLSKVPILANYKPAELGQLADVMVRTKVPKDTDILKQGEEGDMFYILEEGSAIALKDGTQVMSYGEGDYFGELALLNKKSGMRAATVKATSEVRLLTIKRAEFKRLLGNLESVLLAKASSYM